MLTNNVNKGLEICIDIDTRSIAQRDFLFI